MLMFNVPNAFYATEQIVDQRPYFKHPKENSFRNHADFKARELEVQKC